MFEASCLPWIIRLIRRGALLISRVLVTPSFKWAKQVAGRHAERQRRRVDFGHASSEAATMRLPVRRAGPLKSVISLLLAGFAKPLLRCQHARARVRAAACREQLEGGHNQGLKYRPWSIVIQSGAFFTEIFTMRWFGCVGWCPNSVAQQRA